MLRTTVARRSTRRGPDRPSLRRVAAAVLAAALVGGPSGPASATGAASPAGTSAGMTAGTSTATVPSATAPLSWEPPELTAPVTVQVSATRRTLRLDSTRDYVVAMPATPLAGPHGLQIIGGRNVVLVGGRIDIPVEAITGTTHAGRGLLLKDQTGTVHVEGLHITGPGLEDGINIDAGKATVQLQNVRIDLTHGSRAGHHADVLQTWSGPQVLRIDGLTGHTQYQGLFLLPTQFGAAQPQHFDIRRTDLHGTPESAYLMWRDSLAWPMTVEEVYVEPRLPLVRDSFLWPKGTGPGTSAWPDVTVGAPAVGEFVPASGVGLGYTSPGYAAPAELTAASHGLVEAVAASSPPVGVLESVTPVPGGLRVTGWAGDRDTAAPVLVDVLVGGTTHRVPADLPRADVAEREPGLTGTTGFDTVVPLPVGSHLVCVTAVDDAGDGGTGLGCRTAAVADTTAPTVTAAPAVSLRTGVASLAGVFPVTVAWAATDDVAVSGTRLASPVTGTYAPGVASADLEVGTGTSTWAVEATDAAGNVGTGSSAATVTYVPEADATRYNYWWKPSSTRFFGGTALRTNRGGAWLSHTFTGRSVAWVASKEAAGGLADVYVDGVKEATVDLGAPTTTQRSVVFTRSWAGAGTHTVKVVALGGRGKYVTSDGFVTVS